MNYDPCFTSINKSYTILDNSSLDEDLTHGTIKDPSGPATLVVGSPKTGI